MPDPQVPCVGLKRREEFLRAARGSKRVTACAIVQMVERTRPPAGTAGIGYTASRKVGKAVERNRAKRRLRAAWQLVAPGRVMAGWDYVLIARRRCLDIGFAQITAQIGLALDRLMDEKKAAGNR